MNTGSVGSYTLTYRVSDSAGNMATPVSRIVNVIVPVVVVTPPSVGAGGGGGGSASVGVSSPIGTNQNGQTVSQNNNMTLGIAALERLIKIQRDAKTAENQEKTESDTNTDKSSIIVSDIANSESREAITTLIEKGYVKNTKKFDPKRAMTRAEFVKVLSLAYGFEDM